MNCTKCQHENPGDSNFYFEYGYKLDTICSQCGASLLVVGKFCNISGHDLTQSESPQTSRQSSIERPVYFAKDHCQSEDLIGEDAIN